MDFLRGKLAGFFELPYVAALVLATSWTVGSLTARAADVFTVAPSAAPANPEQARAMMEAQRHAARAGQPGQPPGQPPQEAKPDDKDKKKEGEGDKKKEESTTVKRPEKPPRVPDPREFNVKLDEKGRVPPFNFIGQPWPDVLQWLANISKCSLDWQELPNDYLNLTTQRSYALDEVRDLINRHLNARGYISIQSGEVLSVFKLDKIDPSQVRRVNEDQLYDIKPYDFVKVSFELPATMEVDKAKDDVKQVLSPTAKVFPLVSSRRLLIMDSAANLRGVSELLNTERMIQDGRIVPKEFVLKHARPQQVIEILYVLLGVDPKAKPAQTDPQAQQQQMQMMQEMQKQGRDVSKMAPKADAPKVYLAYNRQRNSVLVNAPPDQMKVIEQTIAYLDVPFGAASGGVADAATTGDGGRSMKKYPLTTLDPDKFVKTLEEIGGLSPYAEFKVDDNSKTLFALATPSDHEKISSLVRDFDGSGRHFEVVYLRRLPADAVAATIYKLMAGQNDKDKDKDRRRFYFDWYDNERDNKKKDTIQGFGVDADIENNRLLLWANDVEMERVRELLVKLGEIPGGQQDTRPVRLVEPSDGKPTAALLKELQEAWSASEGNKLIIKPQPESQPTPPVEDKEKNDKAKTDTPAKAGSDRSAGGDQAVRITARFAGLDSKAGETPGDEKAKNPAGPVSNRDAAGSSAPSLAQTKPSEPNVPSAQGPNSGAPVTITVTADGRLMLSSNDTAALDRMEQLIEQLSPPQRRFKVYPLKFIRAIDMYYDLKDYFKDDLEAKDKNNENYDWYFGYRPRSTEEKSGPALSKRRKLMITWDPPSNSILVANASATQLAEIEQLIKEFDKPARSDSVELRQTAPIKIRYSRPSIIAAAVKEVYRDLLSAKDKEFDRGDKKGDQRSGSVERVTEIFYHGTGGGGDDDNRASPVKVGFDGALSLGVDDVSGVLIVSAQKGIFDAVVQMVKELDLEAAPKTTVQVHHVNGNVSAEALQKALDKAVGKAWLGNKPEQLPNQTGAEGDKKQGEKGKGNAGAQAAEKKE